MTNKPMKPVHNGCFYVNETAEKDDICQQVMAPISLNSKQRRSVVSVSVRV